MSVIFVSLSQIELRLHCLSNQKQNLKTHQTVEDLGFGLSGLLGCLENRAGLLPPEQFCSSRGALFLLSLQGRTFKNQKGRTFRKVQRNVCVTLLVERNYILDSQVKVRDKL